jgi:hypothetical protein
MKRITVSRAVGTVAAVAAAAGFWAAPAMAAVHTAGAPSRQIPAYVGPETLYFDGFGPTAAQAITAAEAARTAFEQTHVAGNGPCTAAPYGSEYEGICQAYYYVL